MFLDVTADSRLGKQVSTTVRIRPAGNSRLGPYLPNSAANAQMEYQSRLA